MLAENIGVKVFSVFYAASGGLYAVLLWVAGLNAPHIAILLMLSFAASYGIFKMRNWTTPLMVVLTPTAITFWAIFLYTSITIYEFYPNITRLLIHVGVMIYMILIIASLVFIATKRREFS